MARWDGDRRAWVDADGRIAGQDGSDGDDGRVDDASMTDEVSIDDEAGSDEAGVGEVMGAGEETERGDNGTPRPPVASRRTQDVIDPAILAHANPARWANAGAVSVRRGRVLELTFLGMTPSEIAADIGISVNLVHRDLTYLHYAAAYRLDVEALRLITWQQYITDIEELVTLRADAMDEASRATGNARRSWMQIAQRWRSEQTTLMRDASRLYGLPTTTIQHRAGGRLVGLLDSVARGASPFVDEAEDEDERKP